MAPAGAGLQRGGTVRTNMRSSRQALQAITICAAARQNGTLRLGPGRITRALHSALRTCWPSTEHCLDQWVMATSQLANQCTRRSARPLCLGDAHQPNWQVVIRPSNQAHPYATRVRNLHQHFAVPGRNWRKKQQVSAGGGISAGYWAGRHGPPR